MKHNILVLTAMLLVAVFILSACAGGPQPNGEVVDFTVGKSVSISDGDTEISVSLNQDGTWLCDENGVEVNLCVQMVANRTMFFYGTDKIGAVDLRNPQTILLYGEWKEVKEVKEE